MQVAVFSTRGTEIAQQVPAVFFLFIVKIHGKKTFKTLVQCSQSVVWSVLGNRGEVEILEHPVGSIFCGKPCRLQP